MPLQRLRTRNMNGHGACLRIVKAAKTFKEILYTFGITTAFYEGCILVLVPHVVGSYFLPFINIANSVDNYNTEQITPRTDGVKLIFSIAGVLEVPRAVTENSRVDNNRTVPTAQNVLVQYPYPKIFPLADFRLCG